MSLELKVSERITRLLVRSATTKRDAIISILQSRQLANLGELSGRTHWPLKSFNQLALTIGHLSFQMGLQFPLAQSSSAVRARWRTRSEHNRHDQPDTGGSERSDVLQREDTAEAQL